MTKLVSEQGYYELRGGIVHAIGYLMQINDLMFEVQGKIPRESGVRLDFRPMYVQISDMIDQLRVVMDKP
jgi:hypothetical protein